MFLQFPDHINRKQSFSNLRWRRLFINLINFSILYYILQNSQQNQMQVNGLLVKPFKKQQENYKSNFSLVANTSQTSSKTLQNNSSTALNPLEGQYLTHEEKIQATYNFQSLFRKKSHIYNLHKNKKKNQNKNKNDQSKIGDPDKQSKNVKKGHWSSEQNKMYHWFLELHNKHFILKHLRRTDKIFKTMSTFIGTRQAQQCRSHHQKMQKKYKNFYQIVIRLRMQYYGNCNTSNIRDDLLEHGYIKDKEELIQQSVLKSMQNKQLESHLDQVKKQQNSLQNIDDDDDQQNGSEQSSKKQGNLFFGQNYQRHLNFKL